MSRFSLLLPRLRNALMRCGGLHVCLLGLLLVTTIIAMGIAPAHAALSTQPSEMVATPEGGTPDKSPPLPAVSEAEAEKPGTSPELETGKSRPGTSFDGALPSLARLYELAATATARCVATTRGYDHPRDPWLRLNPGHAPPRG